MLVTTADSASVHMIRRAEKLAEELDCRYAPRAKLSLGKLIRKYNEADVLVVTEQQIRYVRRDGESLSFHPSMSFVRVKRLMRGEADAMIEACGLRPGDSVLDCTAGFASDSIVFAYAVGSGGSVTALESELSMYGLVKTGLQSYETDVPAMNEAMRRIRMVHADHNEYLRQMPAGSVDIVYFDPMFRDPLTQSTAMNPLRALANHAPITEEAIRLAKRAARKAVVLKEQRGGAEFGRLRFAEICGGSHSKIAYGVIRIAANDE